MNIISKKKIIIMIILYKILIIRKKEILYINIYIPKINNYICIYKVLSNNKEKVKLSIIFFSFSTKPIYYYRDHNTNKQTNFRRAKYTSHTNKTKNHLFDI